MKTDDEIYAKISEYGTPRVVVQALQWARLRINHDPDEAEVLIRARIAKLTLVARTTKPARAAQINALKWVIDEGEI